MCVAAQVKRGIRVAGYIAMSTFMSGKINTHNACLLYAFVQCYNYIFSEDCVGVL